MKNDEKKLQEYVNNDMDYLLKRFFTYPANTYTEETEDPTKQEGREIVEELLKNLK